MATIMVSIGGQATVISDLELNRCAISKISNPSIFELPEAWERSRSLSECRLPPNRSLSILQALQSLNP